MSTIKEPLTMSDIERAFCFGYLTNPENNPLDNVEIVRRFEAFKDNYLNTPETRYQHEKFNLKPVLPNFKFLRKEAKVSLRKLEEATGISNGYLSQMESGKIKKPSYEVVMKLIDFYDRHKLANVHPL